MALIGLLALTPLLAAAQTGSISGRVFDETGNRFIQGVFVTLPELDRQAITDLEGRYSFRDVPAGNYTLNASYIGYTPRSQQVSVAAGQRAVADFAMASQLMELEAFQATAEVLAGQARAVNLQRAASGIQNVVNEEVFGQMDDGNIGVAISRMPGLTVDTDGSTEVQRYVNIRGFDASLNAVQLDGNRLSSSGSGSPSGRGRGTAYGGSGRAFRLDDVPADAITNVEIVKSPTPDMDGDALGGTVNLVTKNAFQYDDRFVKIRVAGDYTERRETWGENLALTYAEPFTLGDAEEPNFGITVNLSYSNQNEGFDNLDTDNQWISPSNDALQVGQEIEGSENQDIDNFFLDGPANDYLINDIEAGLAAIEPDHDVIAYIEDIEANNYDINRERIGANLSFYWKANERTELYLKTTLAFETRDSNDYRHHTIMNNDHFDREDPIDQYVSPFADTDPRYDAGNIGVFAGADWEDEVMPGVAYDLDGDGFAETVFNPGTLVRPSGFGSDVVSNIRSSDFGFAFNGEQAGTFYNQDGSPEGEVGYQADVETEDISLTVFNIGGETEFDWGHIAYDGYYSRSTSDYEEYEMEWVREGFQFQYTRPFDDPWYIDYDTVNSDEVDRFALPERGQEDSFDFDEFEWKQYEQEEDVLGLSLDLTWDLPEQLAFSGVLKTGVKWRHMERSFDYDEREYDFDNDLFPYEDYVLIGDSYPYGPVFPERSRDNGAQTVPFTPDVVNIFNDFIRNGADGVIVEEESARAHIFNNGSIFSDYEATEDTYATYFMGDVKTGNFSVIAGVRYEFVDFEQEAFDARNQIGDPNDFTTAEVINNEDKILGKFTSGNKYEQFLPSVHLRYDFLDDKLVTRASWGKTYAKPALKDMVGSVRGDISEDGDAYSINVPNPNLPAQQSENFDISIEYYTDTGGVYQVAFFYKDMNNYAFNVETSYSPEQYRAAGLPALYGELPATLDGIPFDAENGIVRVTTPTADTDAVNYGLELVARQRLEMLPSPFDGFLIDVNATFTESEADYQFGSSAPTQGHSDIMWNLALEYSKYNFFARAKYSFRSDFYENISVGDLGSEIEFVPAQYQFLGDDTFMNPARLDLEFAYTLPQSWIPSEYGEYTFFLNVTNVTEDINASRQGLWNYLDDAYPKERRWNLGFTAEF